jgi:hypothetical protein
MIHLSQRTNLVGMNSRNSYLDTTVKQSHINCMLTDFSPLANKLINCIQYTLNRTDCFSGKGTEPQSEDFFLFGL